MHPFHVPPALAQRLQERRGRVHAFEQLDARRTALVVIDMQNAFCGEGMPLEVPAARSIVPNINRLAAGVRATGGAVVWVSMTVPTMQDWPVFLDALLRRDLATQVQKSLDPREPSHALCEGLLPDRASDSFVFKSRFSAFLPSSCSLGATLRQRGFDTVLVAGTLTNICCESSARDAAMQDFKVVMVSDANAARSDAEHSAALLTFLQAFGDVRTTDDVLELLRSRNGHPASIS